MNRSYGGIKTRPPEAPCEGGPIPNRLKQEPESELIVVALHAERERRAGRFPVGRRAHCLHLTARRAIRERLNSAAGHGRLFLTGVSASKEVGERTGPRRGAE